jgi:glucosamine-6-phosphate deaminase
MTAEGRRQNFSRKKRDPMSQINICDLYKWCSIPVEKLADDPLLKIPFRLVKDSEEMGNVIARDFVNEIRSATGKPFRAIVPCGPKCWYEPFARMINEENISLKNVTVFHMDECLNWQGKLLPKNHPYNFRTFMEKHFYNVIDTKLQVPAGQRFFPEPSNTDLIKSKIAEAPIDITIGGWGQDGHVAYNQARRNSISPLSVEELRNSETRIQENNVDTIIALAQRSFGAAYQFVPPMSVTLGMKECLSANKIRLYSDTGAWKQTALRVALFSAETAEYPITLLQSHSDALLTATIETATHPISENPGWQFEGVNA